MARIDWDRDRTQHTIWYLNQTQTEFKKSLVKVRPEKVFMKSRYDSFCADCGIEYKKGELISYWPKLRKGTHKTCGMPREEVIIKLEKNDQQLR